MLTILKRHDWLLNGAVLFLMAASLLVVYGIAVNLFWQQFLWFLIAIVLIAVVSYIDWRPLANYRWFIGGVYLFSVLLLVVTYFVAPTIRQAKSWLVIGSFQFQTSELMKLALIIILASFFTKGHISIGRLPILIKSFFYFLIPAVLVLMQPDLGTTIILFAIWLGFLLVSGLPWRYIFVGLAIFSLVVAMVWSSIEYCSKEERQSSQICSKIFKKYQRNRIIALFNPNYSPLGVNYNVIQSKIAIGSAGFFGKGFQQGTQVQLGFLPEAATDFVLAALIEEWGLVGGLAAIAAFALIIFRILKIGLFSGNNFSSFICLGAVIMFLIQFTINVGSTVGLLPVIGVTFPFLSYGGSSILINAILLGIVQSITVRSKF